MTTNLDPQVVRAMITAGQGMPAQFQPPGISGLGTPAMAPPAAPPPGVPDPATQPGAPENPGGTPDPTGPNPSATELIAATPTDDLEAGPNADAQDEAALDDLGWDGNPKQGPRGHTQPGFQHVLDRAANQIRSELQDRSKRIAGSLFPDGPAGTNKLSNKALNAYVGRHWDDPSDPHGSMQFRQSLLERMAPKGPDGKRLASGVAAYNKLYHDAILMQGKGRPFQPEDVAPQHGAPPGQPTSPGATLPPAVPAPAPAGALPPALGAGAAPALPAPAPPGAPPPALPMPPG
jgi:hypothetical protein